MMGTVTNFLLCSFVVFVAQGEVTLNEDRPFLRVPQQDQADLECCYSDTEKNSVTVLWLKNERSFNKSAVAQMSSSDSVIISNEKFGDTTCHKLTLKSVELEDSGLYCCLLKPANTSSILSHGTYLQVYRKLRKTINVSENTKNKILRAEGILLFLAVILPAVTLLFQSKKVSQLERKKSKREEENIYQGLNLDHCSPTYDQIERSQATDPYQDVYNTIEFDGEIQLEKP